MRFSTSSAFLSLLVLMPALAMAIASPDTKANNYSSSASKYDSNSSYDNDNDNDDNSSYDNDSDSDSGGVDAAHFTSKREYRETDPEYEEFNPPHIITITTARFTATTINSQQQPTTFARDASGAVLQPMADQNDPARIVGSTALGTLSPQLMLGIDNDRLSFRSNEYFTLYNPHKKTCLNTKETKIRKRVKLGTERCNLHQGFRKDSPITFFWIPVENNLAVLAQRRDNKIICARHQRTGTYFYPCNKESTRYSLSLTQLHGTFKIKDASIDKSRCMDAEFHHALRMKKCGGYKDQAWQKIFVSY